MLVFTGIYLYIVDVYGKLVGKNTSLHGSVRGICWLVAVSCRPWSNPSKAMSQVEVAALRSTTWIFRWRGNWGEDASLGDFPRGISQEQLLPGKLTNMFSEKCHGLESMYFLLK